MLNQFNVSIWGDEAFSAVLSSKSILDIIKTIAHDTSPPLYNITEHIWFQIFGNSEIAIRSLSFLYFLIACFFVYKISSHFWDKKTGILAAILTFLNPFFFTYAFEGRMYSILAATIAASFYFLITKKWALYIIATVLALYSHHFAIFASLVQGIWFMKEFVFGKRKDAINHFKSFIVIGILYIPWIIPLYNQTKMVGGGFWLGRPTLTDFRNLVYKYLAQGIESPLNQVALWIVFVSLVVRKWTQNFQKTLFLGFWFLIPIGIAWIISQKFTSVFFDRYLLYTIPAAMIILVSNRRAITPILLAILISIFVVIDSGYFTHPTKLPFKDLANYIHENKKGDDYLVNWNGTAHHLWEAKYYGLDAPLYLPNNKDLPFFVGTALMTKSDIVYSIPKNYSRVAVITSDNVNSVKISNYPKIGLIKAFNNLKVIWLTH